MLRGTDCDQPVVQQRLLRTRRQGAAQSPQHEARRKAEKLGEQDPGRIADRLHERTDDERGAAAEAVRERPGGDLGDDPDRGPQGEQRRDLRIGQA